MRLSTGILIAALLVILFMNKDSFSPSPAEVKSIYELIPSIGTSEDKFSKFKKAYKHIDAVEYMDIRSKCRGGCSEKTISDTLT